MFEIDPSLICELQASPVLVIFNDRDDVLQTVHNDRTHNIAVLMGISLCLMEAIIVRMRVKTGCLWNYELELDSEGDRVVVRHAEQVFLVT